MCFFEKTGIQSKKKYIYPMEIQNGFSINKHLRFFKANFSSLLHKHSDFLPNKN